MSGISRAEADHYVGQYIYALRKDGTVVEGKLAGVKGDRLSVQPMEDGKARTKAILPLALFDILAISTSPLAFGGFFPGFWWW